MSASTETTQAAAPAARYVEMVRAMTLAGYQIGDGNAADASVVADMHCRTCGGILVYEAWRNARARRYRAVARCPRCGTAEEF